MECAAGPTSEPPPGRSSASVWRAIAYGALLLASCSAPNPAYDRSASPTPPDAAGGRPPQVDASVVGGAGGGTGGSPLRFGLVGAWTFDVIRSGVVADGSGNGTDGQVLGGTTGAFVGGKMGDGFAADGLRWVEVPAGPGLDAIAAELTIAAWVNFAGPNGSNTHAVISRRIAGTNSEHYGLFATGDGKVFTYMGPSFVYGSTRLQPGRWTHVAITYSDRVLRLYVDGTDEGATAANRAPTADVTPLLIGANVDGADSVPKVLWNGLLDEVALWSRALRRDEIELLAAGGKI